MMMKHVSVFGAFYQASRILKRPWTQDWTQAIREFKLWLHRLILEETNNCLRMATIGPLVLLNMHPIKI